MQFQSLNLAIYLIIVSWVVALIYMLGVNLSFNPLQ